MLRQLLKTLLFGRVLAFYAFDFTPVSAVFCHIKRHILL